MPKAECFSSNVELHWRDSIEVSDDLKDEIDGGISLAQYLASFPAQIPREIEWYFSMRITKEGLWLDLGLAQTLLVFFPKIPRQSSRIQKIKPSELFVYLLTICMLSNPVEVSIETACTQFHEYFIQKPIEVIIAKLWLCGTVQVLQKSPSLASHLNEFLTTEPTLMSVVRAILPTGFSPDYKDPSFSGIVRLEFGADIAFWLSILNGFSITATEIDHSCYTTFLMNFGKIRRAFSPLKLPPIFAQPLSDSFIAIDRRQRRQRQLSAKVFRRFERSLTENGGAWSDGNDFPHWKLAQRTDYHFRHIFLAPNRHFDPHLNASLGGDLSNATERIAYDRWIDQKTVNQEDELEPPQKSKLQLKATLITIAAVYEGVLYLTNTQIWFDGIQVSDEHVFSLEKNASKTIRGRLDELNMVLHRSYLHINKGLEFFFTNGRSYFWFFGGGGRPSIVSFLRQLDLPQQPIIQHGSSAKLFAELRVTEQWINRKMSTYQYLMYVNLIAGRSFNDLSQYPVFPWIIADYESDHLDLEKAGTFRDLSKPIGALNSIRLAKLKREISGQSEDEPHCLYRSHYSAAYFILHFMIRLEPFTTMHIKMQGGRFDHANRLFSSIARSWFSVSSTLNDYRELIPEFFSLPEFLTNFENFDLGLQQSDVILPPWASSAADFIAQHRAALESDFVGIHLPHWIDLVFGFQQTGVASSEADNIFHPYSYSGSITPSVLADPEMLGEIQNHAGSFGIIPRQIFYTPHPIRQNLNRRPLSFSILFRALGEVKILEARHNQLFVAILDGFIVRFKRRNRENDLKIPIGRSLVSLSSLIVTVSPSADAFHVYSAETGIPIRSRRQRFSALAAIAHAGVSTLAVLSTDGSLALWDANSREVAVHVHYHRARAIDIAASEELGIIASLDELRTVLIVKIVGGVLMKSWRVKGEPAPIKVAIFDEGFIAILCSGGGGSSIVRVFGFGGEEIGDWECDTEIWCWCTIGRVGAHALGIGTNGAVVVVGMPKGEVLTKVEFTAGVKALAYDQMENVLFVADGDYLVWMASVEC
jgi:hypothetical protein